MTISRARLGALLETASLLGRRTIGVHAPLLLRNAVRGERIAVCVPVRNRTDHLLDCLVASLNACILRHRIVLSVFDCDTTDVADLEQEIRRRWQGELVFRSERVPFSRSHGLNRAIQQAPTERVFCCDADMTLPRLFVLYHDAFVGPGTTWFPICFSLYRDRPRRMAGANGWWRGEGFGMMGALRAHFERIGGFNETFTTWGGEDADVVERTRACGLAVIRYRCPGLYHNWHAYGEWGGRSAPIFQGREQH